MVDSERPDPLEPEGTGDEVESPSTEAGAEPERLLKATAALPALFTIGNGIAGFAAIHFATRAGLGNASPSDLAASAWMILLAMVFDMLDGRVARMTRRTSDFGGQLDSLCDMVSFGAAPAMLSLQTVVNALRGPMLNRVDWLTNSLTLERGIFAVSAIYLACAALRLARFNVENDPDESAHMDFRGLPSPGAAAAVTGMVLLYSRLHRLLLPPEQPPADDWRQWLLLSVSLLLPAITLAVGLLMVSRFRYPHMVNHYIRGRRPVSYIVKLVLIVMAMVLWFYEVAAVVAVVYAFSGPVGATLRKMRRKSA